MFLVERIILQMQALAHVAHLLFRIEILDITCENGRLLIKSEVSACLELIGCWQNTRPQTKEELFNLRHSQLHNIIERIFGILKNKFKLATEPSDYHIDIQCLIPLSLTILHNFLCAYEPNHIQNKLYAQMHEVPLNWRGNIEEYAEMMEDGHGVVYNTEEACADAQRDRIATAMWNQYQSVLAERCAWEQREVEE